MSETERQKRQIAASAIASTLVLLLIVAGSSIYLTLTAKKSDAQGLLPQSKKEETSEDVSFCQLTTDPARYNKKLVKVSAFLSHGFEDSALYDVGCGSKFGVWYEFGGTNSTGTMYCCGVIPSRTRPKQVTVENIYIPLIVDQNFRTLDELLHRPRREGTMVHATLIGRFFSGKKGQAADGTVWWQGYGHMGCCSLFMVQQVVQVDPHNRTDLDYGSSPDQPGINKAGCGYRIFREFGEATSLISLQRQAEDRQEWRFEDPQRVAFETIAGISKTRPSSKDELNVKRQTQGRMVYEWKPKTESAVYMVVVSKPYELLFYSKTDRVAWVPIGAYRSSCDPAENLDVREGPSIKP